MSGREQILVVDDDPLVVRLLRLHLDRAGYRVRSGATGQQAIDDSVEELPDLVILDVMLPDLDGYEVCRQLREFSLVPVILLTAKGEQVDKLRGFELGADDYLTKPFAPQELLARKLAVNAGKVLPHAQLLTQVWGSEYRDDRDYLWTYVRRLRLKLEANPDKAAHIRSEAGFGYLMDCSSV
jgi:DNA-binding response OmpR family regulator